MIDNFAKYVIDRGGAVTELELPAEHSSGLGVCNPSLFLDGDKILCNIRRVNYIFHTNYNGVWQSWYGPSCYHHPDNDVTLTTENYFCELDSNFLVKPETVRHVDYSKFWTKPKWEFIGEEDCRIVKWDGHLYLTGCRRDTENTGISRMELSEIDGDGVEVNRYRVPAPGDDKSYCEKNWMPVLDMPYHYVKWCNPVEVVRFFPEEMRTETVYLSDKIDMKSADPVRDLRGNSQVVTVGNYRIAHVHEVSLWRNRYSEKNAIYYQRFIIWDLDWNFVALSPRFFFMGFEIEFGVGMVYKDGCFYVSFAVYDNAAFVMRIPEEVFFSFVKGKDIRMSAGEVCKNNERVAMLKEMRPHVDYIYGMDDPYTAYRTGIDYFKRGQWACAHAFLLKCANTCSKDRLRYRHLGYDAFLLCMKCNERLGHRVEKLLNMYGQLIDWDPDRYNAYYELSKLYYGGNENVNKHNQAFMFASMAKDRIGRVVSLTGFENADLELIKEYILLQYYVCAYRCSKDYVAVPGLKKLRDSGSPAIREEVLKYGLNLD